MNSDEVVEDDYLEDCCDPWCKICNPLLEDDDLLYENLDRNN